MLEELLPVAQKDKDNYMTSGKTTHEVARRNEMTKYNMAESRVTKWHIIPILRNSEVTEYADELPNLLKKVKDIPGIVNCTLNIYSPGGEAPIHSDYDYDMKDDMVNSKRCYVILLCVNIPNADLDKCGFELGGEKITHKTGDILAFDGAIPHRSWNHTDEYRYTVNIDIEQSYWDNA